MSRFDQYQFTPLDWRDVRRKVVTCAKPHDCHLCGREIQTGVHAVSFAYIDDLKRHDERFTHGHACFECCIENRIIQPKTENI